MYIRVGVDKLCESAIEEVIDRKEDESLFLESVGQLKRWAVIHASMMLHLEMIKKDMKDCITDIDISDYIEKDIDDMWWHDHAIFAVDVALDRILRNDTKVIGQGHEDE